MNRTTVAARVNLKVLLILVGSLAVLGAGVIITHQVRKRGAAARSLQDAQAALAAGNWPQVTGHLRQYLSRYPDDPEVLLRYADANLQIRPSLREHLGAAAGAYRRYLRLKPGDPMVSRALTRLYMKTGEHNEAAYICGQWLDATRTRGVVPSDDERDACLAYAQALIAQRKHLEALGDDGSPLRVAVTRYPQTADSYVLFSSIVDVDESPAVRSAALAVLPSEQTTGTPSQADLSLALLNLGVSRCPDSAVLLAHRARFHRLARRDIAAAQADLEAADRLTPTDPVVLLAMLEEWSSPEYRAAVPDHLNRAEAELAALDRVDAATLATYHLKPEDVVLPRMKAAANLSLHRGMPADPAAADAERARKTALADEALSRLTGDSRADFLPLALELYLVADRMDLAEKAAAEYRAAVAEMLGVSQAVRDRVVLLEAVLASARGEWYKIIESLEPLVTANRDEESTKALRFLTAAYNATGQPGRVIHRLGLEGDRWKSDPGVLLQMVSACSATKRWAEAERYAEILERISPEHQAQSARLLRIRARIAAVGAGAPLSDEQRGHLLKELAELRQRDPRAMDVRLLEAETAFRPGRPDEAIQLVDRAIDECGRPLAAMIAKIDYCRRARRYDEALQACRAAMEQHPDSAAPRLARAEILLSQNKPDEAAAAFEETVAHGEALERAASDDAARTAAREQRELALNALAQYCLSRNERARAIDLWKVLSGLRADNKAVRCTLLRLPEVAADRAYAQSLVDDLKKAEGPAGLLWRLEQARLLMAGIEKTSTDAGQLEARQQIGELLTRCIDADPSWAEPVLMLGGMYVQLEQDARAEELYRRWLKVTPGEFGVTNQLLSLLRRQNRFNEMDAILDRIPENDQGRVLHQLYALSAAVGTGDYERAIGDLEEVVQKNPGDAAAHVLLAELYHAYRKDTAGALRVLDQALQATPDYFSAVATKVAVLNAAGRNEEAEKVLTAEVERRKDFQSYRLRANFYLTTGRLDLAEQDFMRLAGFSESAAQGHGFLGAFYEQQGRLDKAIAAWEEGLKRDPGDSGLNQQLIRAMITKGDAETRRKGIERLDALLTTSPGSPELLLLRSRAMMAEGGEENLRRARELLDNILRTDPHNTGAYMVFIELCRRPEGRSVGAPDEEEIIARGLAANRNHAGLLMALADLKVQQNRMAEALDAAVAAADADRRNVQARNLAAELALELGQLDAAAQHNQQALSVQPVDLVAQLTRARILHRRQPAEAIRYLESICTPDGAGSSIEALLLLGEYHRGEQAFEASDHRITQAEKLAPGQPAVIQARVDWLAAQDRQAEIPAFVQARLAHSPDDLPVLLHAASRVAAAGPEHAKEALDFYERALRIDPRQPQALNDKAWLLAVRLGRLEEGLAAADEGLRHYPDNPHLLDTRGAIRLRLRQYEGARADLEKCLTLATRIPVTRAIALYHLGKVYENIGERTLARRSLMEAMDIDRETRSFDDGQREEITQVLARLGG